ncbi:MAG: hypothetical protein HY695_30465 [Deltaproteobacteria bacterium]|nr:hypothetical protein [Deltaproteobacteria bacterium]
MDVIEKLNDLVQQASRQAAQRAAEADLAHQREVAELKVVLAPVKQRLQEAIASLRQVRPSAEMILSLLNKLPADVRYALVPLVELERLQHLLNSAGTQLLEALREVEQADPQDFRQYRLREEPSNSDGLYGPIISAPGAIGRWVDDLQFRIEEYRRLEAHQSGRTGEAA